jgi:8-oxo-dGTP diphosphatase
VEIPECFYRISVKALVLNETRDKFLITKEASGKWEIPGGGLDWQANVQEELNRELMEETGLQAIWIANHPAYFTVSPILRLPGAYAANIVFETKLNSLDFTPSDECIEIDWINKDNADQFDLFPNIPPLLEQFDPNNHLK